MTKPSICCVVPSIRPERMTEFREAWASLFEKHNVTLLTVWDGEVPTMTENGHGQAPAVYQKPFEVFDSSLFCRKTDAVRNWGFAQPVAARADYILTLDDDVHPPAGSDPIQEHLDVLQRRVPISWMNTATDTFGGLFRGEEREGPAHIYQRGMEQAPYLRGFPYGIRDEAPVKVSHGVWVNVPDFDGRTQLELGKCSCDGGTVRKHGGMVSDVPCPKCNGTGYDGSRLPYSLPYFRGPIPKGVYMPICGMSLMVHRDALPYLYFAPMGPDSGVEGLNRFADIWMGLLLKRAMDSLGWAIYTGASTVIHTRASDPFKNVEQEKLGIEWNEWAWKMFTQQAETVNASPEFITYWKSYLDKANRFRKLIRELQGAK